MSERTGDRDEKAAADRAAKARLVFGDPLERQTSDDTDRGWGGPAADGEGSGGRERGLDWYRSQRPPHHGD